MAIRELAGVPGTAGSAVERLDRPGYLVPDEESDATDDQYLVRAFQRYAPRLRGFALAMVHDPDAADDVVSEAVARLIAEVHAGRRPDNPGAWLHRVCVNLVVSGARRTSCFRRAIPRMAETGVSASPEDAAERHEADGRVLHALAGLPAEARAVLLLAADGHDSREIGALIGRSPLATRAYLCRMRGRLHRVTGA